MSVSVNSSVFSGFMTLPSRVLAAIMPSRLRVEDGFDPYEPAPVSREEVSKLFALDAPAPWTPDNEMRASERRELDSMAMIRGALYADN